MLEVVCFKRLLERQFKLDFRKPKFTSRWEKIFPLCIFFENPPWNISTACFYIHRRLSIAFSLGGLERVRELENVLFVPKTHSLFLMAECNKVHVHWGAVVNVSFFLTTSACVFFGHQVFVGHFQTGLCIVLAVGGHRILWHLVHCLHWSACRFGWPSGQSSCIIVFWERMEVRRRKNSNLHLPVWTIWKRIAKSRWTRPVPGQSRGWSARLSKTFLCTLCTELSAVDHCQRDPEWTRCRRLRGCFSF